MHWKRNFSLTLASVTLNIQTWIITATHCLAMGEICANCYETRVKDVEVMLWKLVFPTNFPLNLVCDLELGQTYRVTFARYHLVILDTSFC